MKSSSPASWCSACSPSPSNSTPWLRRANTGALMIGLLVATIGACAGYLEAWPINPARDLGPQGILLPGRLGPAGLPGAAELLVGAHRRPAARRGGRRRALPARHPPLPAPGAGLRPHPRLDHMNAAHVLAIDQGTTSTRAIVFDAQARSVALARREFAQHYPASGWVEHDAEDIWHDTRRGGARGDRAGRLRSRRESRPSASPTSARPRWCGSAPPAARCTAPSSGRTGARPTSARA